LPSEFEFGDAFQKKLLALYVRSPQTAYTIIEPSYFTNPLHVDIARLTKEVYEKHNRSEVILSRPTLLAIVKGYLGKSKSEVWPGYRREIKALYDEDLKDRQVVLHQAVGFAKEQKFRKALVEAEKDVNSKNFVRAIQRFDSLKGLGAELDLGIEYWKDATNPGRWLEDRYGIIGTHYCPTLDDCMEGGLGAGELGVILGKGKGGKSTLIARFAAGAMWQNKNVAIATGELSGKKYRKRIDSMMTAIPTWRLTQYAKVSDEKSDLMKKLRQAQRRMVQAHGQMKGRLFIKQWPTNRGRVSDIESWLERLKQSGVEIDILFVDYIRVFKPNERFEEQRLSIGQVCMDLRGLAVERDIPVWTASQTNRGALNKERVGPEDIAEDISQFWTLDFMIALCQTEAEAKLKPQQARLLMVAARDVMMGKTIKINIDRNTFRVWEKFGNFIAEKEKWRNR
jgi:hypothetical protein